MNVTSETFEILGAALLAPAESSSANSHSNSLVSSRTVLVGVPYFSNDLNL
jgi:hypothetical protein